jgi:hypothetical protein
MPFSAGLCLPSPFLSGHSATWFPGRYRITGGIKITFRIILEKEKQFSPIFCKFHGDFLQL